MFHCGRLFLLAMATALAAAFPVAAQQERIHRYHSAIEVLQDGSMRVTETITVTAAGDKIKRGIYRDFPTSYRTKFFVRINLPFDIVSVKRDGQPEPYHTKQRANGMRIYVGNKDRHVPRGKHTYEITYKTNYWLGFFDEHDELYWNVTGVGWEFPIDLAEASVTLPDDVPRDQIKHEGYTGPQGAKGQAYTSTVNEQTGTVDFATTAALGRREGLTIVVQFPKGFVHKPTKAEQTRLFMKANLALGAMVFGLLVLFTYYFVAWSAVGRDPPSETIVPRFEPPLQLAPACVRYLRRMGYDKKCFTSALLNMAVKQYLTIEDDDGEFELKRNKTPPKEKLSRGEKGIAKSMLGSGAITLKQTNHRRIRSAIQKLGKRLTDEFDGSLFVKNRWYLLPGWLLSAAAVFLVALCSGWEGLGIAGFMSIWLSGWTAACAALAHQVIASWRSVIALRRDTLQRIGSLGGAIFITAFSLPFFAGEVFGIVMLVIGTTIWMLPLVVGIITLNWLFWHLIKRPSVEGKRVMDHIEGFRMYLGTAEGDFLDRLHPPEKTPELFERYLPYALALDVENQWAERFADVLAAAATQPGRDGGYRPSWYRGSHFSAASAGAFAGTLGSALGGAISSSSTAPGSSSGGGGGGSSGGGGGGGGGGGW